MPTEVGRNPRGYHSSSRDTPSGQGLLPPTVQTRGRSRAKDQNSSLALFPPMLLGDCKSHLCWTHIPFQGDLLHLALGRGQLCQVAPHWATAFSPQWMWCLAMAASLRPVGEGMGLSITNRAWVIGQ